MTSIDELSSQVLDRVKDLPRGDHALSFDFQGRTIHARLRLRTGARTMVVAFHGAVDRKTRTPPMFLQYFNGLGNKAHQLSIADPLVTKDSPSNITWYAGSSEFDTQGAVAAMCQAVAQGIKAKRTVYFGTSGGGFAALYFSHRHEGSFAVVGNPQTRIASYYPGAVRKYMTSCWPGIETPEALEAATCANLAALYEQGAANTVIYVQSVGDRMHTENHMLPFAGAMGRTEARKRFILQSEYWGTMGHVPVVPEYLIWLHAVCDAKEATTEGLLQARHDRKLLLASRAAGRPATPAPRTAGTAAPQAPRVNVATAAVNGLDEAALRIGARLQAWRDKQGASK